MECNSVVQHEMIMMMMMMVTMVMVGVVVVLVVLVGEVVVMVVVVVVVQVVVLVVAMIMMMMMMVNVEDYAVNGLQKNCPAPPPYGSNNRPRPGTPCDVMTPTVVTFPPSPRGPVAIAWATIHHRYRVFP